MARPGAAGTGNGADALAPSKNGKRRRRRKRAAGTAEKPPAFAPASAGNVAGTVEGGPHRVASRSGSAGAKAACPRKRRRRRRGRTAQPAPEPARLLSEGQCGAADKASEKSTSEVAAAKQPDQAATLSNDLPRAINGHPRGSAGPLYAALDLGTNNCRLLVAAPTRPGQFRVVDAFSRIVRLGEGLSASGRLSEPAMARAIDALKACASKLSSREIRNSRLIATEACRSAVNGAAFLSRVKQETGLELEIVDRETEARLAVSGCSSLVESETDSVVLFDIGGGSSEIAVIELPQRRSSRLANHIRAWTSLPVGVVSLSERFGGRDVTRETFEAMVADVERMLSAFLSPELPGMNGHHAKGSFHLIGTSGTVTTLAGVYLDLPRYDRRRVDGLWLSSEEVDRMLEKILSWDFDQRSANPCIGADRADLVLAGCAIMEGIRRRWPAERMRVADRGLREGLLTDMMAADGVWRRRRGRFPGTDRGRFRQADTSGEGGR